MDPLQPEPAPRSRYRTAEDADDPGPGSFGPGLKPLGGGKGLGSLAQSARLKRLKTAQIILLILGGLILAVNAVQYPGLEAAVDEELNKLVQAQGPGAFIDPQARQAVVNITRAFVIGMMGLGVVFLVCAALVKRYPIPTTLLSLVLLIGMWAVLGFINPLTLVQGLLLKLVALVGLVKAVQSAFAYEAERKAAGAEI